MTKTATRTTGKIVPANRTPRIGDIIPGTVVYRWAIQRSHFLTSELPCHVDQLVSIWYDPDRPVEVDQTVVCRRCFSSYAATPVPDDDIDGLRIVFRHTGNVAMSRPKRAGE